MNDPDPKPTVEAVPGKTASLMKVVWYVAGILFVVTLVAVAIYATR